MKWRLNSGEIIRCCASCKHVYFNWEEDKNWGGCPSCGFASYGARFVYGDWSYFYVLIKALWYKDKEPFPTFKRIKSWINETVTKILGYCSECDQYFVVKKRICKNCYEEPSHADCYEFDNNW